MRSQYIILERPDKLESIGKKIIDIYKQGKFKDL